MIVTLIVLLTICTCDLKEGECGGTLDKPIPDECLCENLIPPGMESIASCSPYNMYDVQMQWYRDDDEPHDYFVMVAIYSNWDSFQFHGYMLQGRVNNKPSGAFYSKLQPEELPNNTWINCPPFTKVRYINIPQRVILTDIGNHLVTWTVTVQWVRDGSAIRSSRIAELG